MKYKLIDCLLDTAAEYLNFDKHFSTSEVKMFKKIIERDDIRATIYSDCLFGFEKDPSLSCMEDLLYKKGALGLLIYRVSHELLNYGYKETSFKLYSLLSMYFAMDIDPRCTIGSKVYIDHGTGVVIGATARIGNEVLIFHGVTLGSLKLSSVRDAKRHPTIGNNVVIGCHSILLGNIQILDGSRISANSFVTASGKVVSKILEHEKEDV